MNKWSRKSQKRLETCHPDLQRVFDVVLQIMDCSIECGYRGYEAQHRAFLDGFSKVDYPDGKHNGVPSDAADVKPYVPEVKIDGNNPKHLKYFYHFAGIVLGVAEMMYHDGEITHRLRWGGDWDMDDNMDDQTFNDLYHYELIK